MYKSDSHWLHKPWKLTSYTFLQCISLALLSCVSLTSHAFQCYLTIVKDSCWKDFQVTIQAQDASSNQVLTTVTVPEGELWSRQAFSCTPSQVITFDATFSPVFWQQQQDKHFAATDIWSLPSQPKANEAAWNLTICYPKEFPSVPLPPSIHPPCVCDIQNIPAP